MCVRNLECLFKPRSVAVIGASIPVVETRIASSAGDRRLGFERKPFSSYWRGGSLAEAEFDSKGHCRSHRACVVTNAIGFSCNAVLSKVTNP